MFRKKVYIFAFAAILSAFVFLFAQYCFLPGEINITQGSESSIAINLPLRAQIENAPAMTINDKPVSGNINISLLNPVSIKADKEATLKTRLSIMGITVKNINLNVKPQVYVIPSGKTVGIRLDTDGVLVLGTGQVDMGNGEFEEPAENILKSGDLITKVNGIAINNKEELQSAVKSSSEPLRLDIIRSGCPISTTIVPVKSDNENKIGVWVRDSTQGIGTITFINPEKGTFAALGHPVTDVDTKKIMPIKKGIISNAEINKSVKGEKGTPGELSGEINYSDILGTITVNSENGIHGIINNQGKNSMDGKAIPIGGKNDVAAGKAYILSTIEGSQPQKYEINIDEINKYTIDNTKNMTITVTDKTLLEKTGGIVQGMSGSPIIQNGKLVGAVTHVFVQQPNKGYAIFAENMCD